MIHRVFSERLNQQLSDIGMPEPFEERVDSFAKVFKTGHFKAASLLNGNDLPNEALLKKISQELEVSENWLLGKDQKN